MEPYLIVTLIITILAVIAAAFSDDIEKAVNGGDQFRKVMLVFCAGVIVVGVITIVVSIFA